MNGGGSPLLRLDGIGKHYGADGLVLDGISADIPRGAFVSLLGPSGCGKSTLLRLIAGLSAPSTGALHWPSSKNSMARDIGFVFQDATLMPWARIFDNVHMPLKLRGVSRDAARPRVNAALERVGLDGVAQAFPRELSGGMKMRVSIARALVTEPPVLLMDEPFAALDEITRETLDDDLLALWQDQTWTIIFVTHSVYEAVYLSQRVLVMSAAPGRLIADIAIDAPYPRGSEFRGSPAYFETCRHLSAALRRGMGE